MLSFLSATLLAATSLLYINEAVVDMRESPNHTSKVVSQAVYAEKIIIEKESDGWAHIATPDNYSGWVPSSCIINVKQPYHGTLKISRLCAHVFGVRDTEYGPILTLPYGAELELVDDQHARWNTISLLDGTKAYVQKGDVLPEPKLTAKGDLVAFSQKFLGLPYTWGGRFSFGYDCSGFTQMLYAQMGIALQRDARLQILDPRLKEVDVKALEAGDLVFFGKSETDIRHVGLYIGNGQMIHTSAVVENKPWVRISSLSDFHWSGNKDANYPYRTTRKLVVQASD